MRFACLMLALILAAGAGSAARGAGDADGRLLLIYVQNGPSPHARPLVPAVPLGNRAQHRRDLDRGGRGRALEGVRRGEIRPLEEVMSVVQRRYPGRVLDVRLDERRLIYHLRVLSPTGNVLRLRVNARNARIMSVEGRR